MTCFPDSGLSLPNSHAHASHEDILMKSSPDLFFRSPFEKQLQRLSQIGSGRLDALSLADDIDFGTECYIDVIFFLDNCC